MYTPDQLVPDIATVLGIRLGMAEEEVRARFGESLHLQSEVQEVGGKTEFWETKLPDGPGDLTIRFMDGVVLETFWIVQGDDADIGELSKNVRVRLKKLYGKPVGADKVYRGETPLGHHAWTTRWGSYPTSFKLGMYRGPGAD